MEAGGFPKTMKYIRIKKWREFQHYKNRRPPWIKLHTKLLRDPAFAQLPDRAKLTAHQIWMLVAIEGDEDGRIEAWKVSRESLGMETKPMLKVLADSGLLFYESSDSLLANLLCNSEDSVSLDLDSPRETFSQESAFAQFWQLCEQTGAPKPFGRSLALNLFCDSVSDPALFVRFLAARANYAASERVAKGFAKDADKWVADWPQWEKVSVQARRDTRGLSESEWGNLFAGLDPARPYGMTTEDYEELCRRTYPEQYAGVRS